MAYNVKSEAELRKADDIAVVRAQLRRLVARAENLVVPVLAKRHDVALLTGEQISLRYSDAELVDLLRSELALKIDNAG